MKTTPAWPSLDVPEGGEDPFADLRAAYLKRLRSERQQLTRLRAGLGSAGTGSGKDYETIRRIAHGMAGAAAIFKADAILTAAVALDHALRDATAGVDTAAVRPALDAMIDSLRSM
jgi:HPt (histidine-containing phosphotransfer) domain-containing protein